MSLRKNTARVRYWLWLAASVKFLIPFSLLITVGSHLWHGSAQTNAGFYHAIDAVGQPFLLPLIPETSGAYPSTVLPRATPLVAILFAVWLSGFLLILFVWFARWRRISATVRKAVPLREGREVEVLRRMMAVGAYGNGSRFYWLALLSNLEFSESRGPSCYGRRASPNVLTMRTWKRFSRTNYGTYSGATIWPLRCTCWSKRFPGSTPCFGGWERDSWKSANARATKKS